MYIWVWDRDGCEKGNDDDEGAVLIILRGRRL